LFKASFIVILSTFMIARLTENDNGTLVLIFSDEGELIFVSVGDGPGVQLDGPIDARWGMVLTRGTRQVPFEPFDQIAGELGCLRAIPAGEHDARARD
jgi:hypothetical protein